MTDQTHAAPSHEHDVTDRRSQHPAGSVDAWVQAALSLGRGPLREQIAVPHPLGGYRIVTRDIVGTRR